MSEEASKHSPRIDELLQHETASLLGGAPDEGRDEGRLQQASGPGEPDLALPDRSLPGDPADRLAEDELDRRARLAAAVAPAHFPATSRDLAEVAEAEHLATDLLDELRALDPDQSFETVQEVWLAIGGSVEGPRNQDG